MDNAIEIIDRFISEINADIRVTQAGILELQARRTALTDQTNILENVRSEINNPKEKTQ